MDINNLLKYLAHKGTFYSYLRIVMTNAFAFSTLLLQYHFTTIVTVAKS